MPLVSTPVSNLINGVSQQADVLRFPGQCTEQINRYSSVVDGLIDRPPLNHIVKLNDVAASVTQVDLLLLMDDTGSQNGAIAELQSQALQVIDKFSPFDTRFALMSFKDHPDIDIDQDFTTDVNAIKSAINALVAEGGDDAPESGYQATTQAVSQLSWSGREKFVVLISDATSNELGGATYTTTLATLNSIGAKFIYYDVAEAFSGYEDLATNTSGATIRANSSGVPTSGKTMAEELFDTASDAGALVGERQFVHHINRDINERYVSIVLGKTTPALKVYDLAGNEMIVRNKNNNTLTPQELVYLASATPRESLKAMTVADFTYILNSDIQTELTTDLTTSRDPEALVFVKTSKYLSTYTIKLWNSASGTGSPNFTGTFTSESNASNPVEAQGEILKAIRNDLNTNSANTVYSYTLDGSLLHIKKIDNSDFRIEVEGDATDSIFSFKESVQDFNLLPANKGWAGFNIKVIGDPDDDEENAYYVEFNPSNENITTGFTAGSWAESRAGGIKYKFDDETMPHVLVSTIDDASGTVTGTPYAVYFQFKPATWGERLVGDDDSNPEPSFIGNTIRDVYFYRNRLGFLSDENAILSEAGEFFNFWRTTVIQLLDSDPIDIGATHTKISLLNWAIPNSENLVVFSDQTQFTLQGGDLLTPKTASMTQTTEAENLKNVRPISIGNSIYFAVDKEKFSGVSEYSIRSDTGLFEPFDVTGHVPNYIDGSIFKLVGSKSENIILALNDGFPNGVSVYKFYNAADGRNLQSAWFKFDFGKETEVRDAFMIDSRIYFVIARHDGTYLEFMDIATGLKDEYSTFSALLDRKISDEDCSNITFNPATNKTTLTLPYSPDPTVATMEVVTRSTSGVTRGYWERGVTFSGNTLTINGDYSETPMWIGQKYSSEYEPTRPLIRSQQGDVLNEGRFQVLYGNVTFDNSAYFKVEVTPKFRDSYEYEFISRLVGSATIGEEPSLEDGTYRFPVKSKNDQVDIKIINDSPFPSNLLNIDWEGRYTRRSAPR